MAVSRTPTPTKVALVGVLLLTAGLLASFLAGSDDEGDARAAGLALVALTILFGARVFGQLLVRARAPRFLPPMYDWNLMPYRFLLPIQLLFLVLMTAICVDLLAREDPSGPWRHFGRVAIAFSFVYAAAMVVRYAVRMARRPGERWFGGTIPIVFHLVLATFVFVLGSFHAA